MRTEVMITLTVQEMDYVMNTLAQRPFVEVNGLISKMLNQANARPTTTPESVEGEQA